VGYPLVGGPDLRPEVLHDLAGDVGLREPARICTGLMSDSPSGRSNTLFMSTASSSAGTPSSITVRWPTGFMNPVDRPRDRKPSRNPSAAVVFPRFCPVAAR